MFILLSATIICLFGRQIPFGLDLRITVSDSSHHTLGHPLTHTCTHTHTSKFASALTKGPEAVYKMEKKIAK